MAADPDEFYARVLAAADADRRLPLPDMAGWNTMPYELEGLRTVPLDAPSLPEPARQFETEAECLRCAERDVGIWRDDNWRLVPLGPTGLPLVLMLMSRAHYDVADLPDPLAAEFGRLIVHLTRAIEALPNIARAHTCRWGDGSAHLHVWFLARPAGFVRLRGTFAAVWDDILPPVPVAERDRDAAEIARALSASHGGVAT